MFNTKFYSLSINQVTIDTDKPLKFEEAKKRALAEVTRKKYRGSFIKRVIVNGMLVLENFQNES